MEIDPKIAFAKREHTRQTFYFCSQSCVDQFDRDPHRFMTTSATTGFNPERALSRIELHLTEDPSNDHLTHVEAGLRDLPRVAEVKTNTKQGRLAVSYDPETVDLALITQEIKAAGYEVGTKAIIGVDNLHCASCVRFIEDELRSTPGVLSASLNIGTQQATVEYLPAKTTVNGFQSSIPGFSDRFFKRLF